MVVEHNKQVARRAFEALMTRNLGALEGLLRPDAVLHQCGFLEPIPARAIVRGDLPGQGPLENREARLDRIIGEGDIVALHWSTAGQYSDPESPKLDGTIVSFPSMTFIRFEKGGIAEIWNIQDRSTLQAKLGWESALI